MKTTTNSTVLKGIVQHDHINVIELPLQLLHTSHPVLTHRHRHIRKCPMHLHRLVTDSVHSRVTVCHHKTACLAFVPPGEHRRVVTVVQQQLHDIRGHRCLSRSSHSQVTHTDRRHLHRMGKEQVLVIQHMAQVNACFV